MKISYHARLPLKTETSKLVDEEAFINFVQSTGNEINLNSK